MHLAPEARFLVYGLAGWTVDSAYVAIRTGRRRPSDFLNIAVYGLATLVSASRFSGQKHFASDIVAGGVMGWFIGRHVFETH